MCFIMNKQRWFVLKKYHEQQKSSKFEGRRNISWPSRLCRVKTLLDIKRQSELNDERAQKHRFLMVKDMRRIMMMNLVMQYE